MSEWISVEDRLPEETGQVIVGCNKTGGIVRCINWFEGRWREDYDEPLPKWITKDFTHWQPLPDPPE